MRNSSTLKMRLARSEPDVRGAQRLRYKVFVEELGGDGEMVDHADRFEIDQFDPFTDQLILVDSTRSLRQFEHVVGVYRLLRSDQAARIGKFYSEGEYELTPLINSGRKLLELGRSCIDEAYRGGPALFQMWQGLAEYVTHHGSEVMFGTASFHGTDIAKLSQPLSHLHYNYLARPELRPRALLSQPMDILPPESVDRPAAMRAMPALIKAYLRLGGTVGEGAFIDHAFNTVDVCLVMDTAEMSAKHRDLYTKARA